MRNATRALFVFVLAFGLSATAYAQTAADTVQITFQVDLSEAVTKNVFAPGTDTAEIRGSFNGYTAGANVLTRVGTSNVYATTIGLAKGDTVAYKFWGSPTPVGWENDVTDETPNFSNNRDYIVPTANATLDAVAFNKEFVAVGGTAKYRITFQVDMGVAALSEGTFDQDGDDIVVIAGDCKPDSISGCLNGWSTTADTLSQDFFNPNLYAKTIEIDNFPIPATGNRPNIGYKYVIGTTPGTAPAGWESVPDRILTLPTTGEGADGFIEVTVDPVFYNNVDDSQIFTTEETIIFEVDLRPAYYYVADNGGLPSDTQTGGSSGSEVTGVALNGPAAGKAKSNDTGISDWADWGNTLSQIPARNFKDDGTQGDATAGDSIWTQTFTYAAGTPKTIVGKFGANGFDNESGFGGDTSFDLGTAADGNGRVRAYFGAVRQSDGTYTDLNGPSVAGGAARPVYDPYLVISGDSMSVTVVRRGGTATAIEPGAGAPNGAFVLTGASPNPSNGVTRFSYELVRAGDVQLSVFDMQGREVARLFDGTQGVGTYDVSFDASALAAGVYLYRLAAGGEVATSQLVVVR